MKSNTLYRIAGALALIILELIVWGSISGNQLLLEMALVNVFLLVVLFGKQLLQYAESGGLLSPGTTNKIMNGGYAVLRGGGLLVVCGIMLWKLFLRLLGSGAGMDVLLRVLVLSGGSWIVRDDLLAGNITRGKNKLDITSVLLLVSIFFAGACLVRFWTRGSEKFVVAGGLGLLVYTIGLLGNGLSIKEIFQKASWIVYSMLILIAGVRAATTRSIQRLDNHTIEKVVIQEKEKIVYIEKETQVDDILEDEDDTDENIAEEDVDEMLEEEEPVEQNRCPEGQCYRIDTCVVKPEGASCTDSDEEAWACDEGYTEVNGTCYEICAEDQCQSGTTCVEKPLRSICVESADEVWRCEAGFVASGEECVPIVVPITQSVVSVPVAIPEPEPEPEVDMQLGTQVDVGAFINPEPQQSVIQQRTQQTLSPVERLRLQNQ